MNNLLGGGEIGSRGKSQVAWLKACKWMCCLQLSGGLVLAICSSLYLFSYSKESGQIIGFLLIGVGGIGLYGSAKCSREALNAHLMGVVLALMLAFQFMGQVGREMDVDCAIAEMYIRGKTTEGIVKSQQETTMFNTIYTRLNEMENMMSMVNTGVVKSWEHSQEQLKLKNMDLQYIEGKVDLLQKQAMNILEGIANHPSIKSQEYDGWKEEDKEYLSKIVDTASRIHSRLSSEDGVAVSYDDYKKMLEDIKEALQIPILGEHQPSQLGRTHVEQAYGELSKMEEVIERAAGNKYEEMKIGHLGEQLAQMEKERSEKREQWFEKFNTALDQHSRSDRIEVELQDFPQHCIIEDNGRQIMGVAGFVVLLSQLVSGYCALTAIFKIPVKTD